MKQESYQNASEIHLWHLKCHVHLKFMLWTEKYSREYKKAQLEHTHIYISFKNNGHCIICYTLCHGNFSWHCYDISGARNHSKQARNYIENYKLVSVDLLFHESTKHIHFWSPKTKNPPAPTIAEMLTLINCEHE